MVCWWRDEVVPHHCLVIHIRGHVWHIMYMLCLVRARVAPPRCGVVRNGRKEQRIMDMMCCRGVVSSLPTAELSTISDDSRGGLTLVAQAF